MWTPVPPVSIGHTFFSRWHQFQVILHTSARGVVQSERPNGLSTLAYFDCVRRPMGARLRT